MDSLFSLIASYLFWDVKQLLMCAAIFAIVAELIKTRPAHFPPGPRTFPIVGNMLSIDNKKYHLYLTELAGTFGNVYSLRIGYRYLVVLNGFDTVKEALVTQGDSFVDRPTMPLQVDVFNRIGVLFSSGDLWKQQRRFAQFTLRNFGFGKKSLEPVILDEFRHCVTEITGYKGQPFDPHLIVNSAVSNIVCSLVFGHRFDYHDETFRSLVDMCDKAFKLESTFWTRLYNSFPRLMRCLPGPHKTLLKNWDDMKVIIREELKDHKQKWDPSDLRDFIDCYLNEIQTRKGQVDSTFFDENLVQCVTDFFVAGTETTSTTMLWALLYMTKYPEIQEKVQAEIDAVIGRSRQPSMEDRVNLPYTDAVIHEIQRFGNIAPLSLPHSTTREVQLGGYTIPKGVTVIPNLTSVLLDKKEWETPHSFNPGHFLTEDGKFVKPAAFIPFSAGKRQCPGESLAKMELFLFFTSFMQRYTVSMPAGVKAVLDYSLALSLAPQHYKLCAVLR